MKQRRRSLAGWLAAIVPLLASMGDRAAAVAPKPNIVMILADDLGIGDLGYGGQNARAAQGLPAISTPNIDALAASGVSFSTAYATPFCSASRATLLTGFNEAHASIKEATLSGYLRKQETTFAEVLKTAGYSTGMFGKWHVGGVVSQSIVDFDSLPTQQGFDTVFGTLSGGYRVQKMWENDGATGNVKLVDSVPDPGWTGSGQKYEYTDIAHTRHAVDYIKSSATSGQPFAAYVALQEPHDPFNEGPIDPQYANANWSALPNISPANQAQQVATQKGYASMVSRLDSNVGKILAAIDDPNGDGNTSDSVANNTLVIFASDNGPYWPGSLSYFDPEYFNSNQNLSLFKASTLEGGTRVPFLVKWQGVTQPGTVNNSVVGEFADILPTFAELAGADTPLGIDGKSLVPAITGQGQVAKPDAMSWTTPSNFSAFDLSGWSVRVGDFKLTYRQQPSGHYLLNNMAADPSELTNLASSRPDILAALQQVAYDEGLGRSPYLPHSSVPSIAVQVDDWFTQFKAWAPSGGSTDFSAASNWSGGTPTYGVQNALSSTQPAQNWNTGPAENWLATVANTTGGTLTTVVSSNSQVLAMEVKATAGTMKVVVAPGVNLDARNGLRIGAGGVVQLNGGRLRTLKQIDIRAGGTFIGSGNITGWQDVLAGIPEFQGKNLLAPEVVNSGQIDIQNGSLASTLTVTGDFRQTSSGLLQIDLFGNGNVPGVDYDKLTVSGTASLGGSLLVNLQNLFTPAPGQIFSVLTAGSLSTNGLQLTGPLANFFTMSATGTTLALQFISADFDGNRVVNANDLAILKNQHGSVGSLGDSNGDNRVDGADLAIWQRQLGLMLPSSLSAVPEPASLATGIIAMAVGLTLTRRQALRREFPAASKSTDRQIRSHLLGS